MPSNEVTRLSYSSVATYMDCARKWRFRYLDKIKTPRGAALAFGSAAHNAIEHYWLARAGDMGKVANVPREGEMPSMVEIWDYEWGQQLIRNKDMVYSKSDGPESLRVVGQTIFANEDVRRAVNAITPITGIPFKTWRSMSQGPMIEAQVHARIPGVSVPITGVVDVVCDDGVPLDLKTAGRMWAKGKEDLEIQPDFYLAAMNQGGWTMNPEFKFRYLIITKSAKPKVQLRETTRTVGQVFWVLEATRQVWEGVSKGVFPPSTGGYLCNPNWCDYWDICRGK